jgi:cupin fold WbuC family metalloprotein
VAIQPTAVKALIYDTKGNILLQKRDEFDGIMEPGRWGFFGGMVEQGETLEEALVRELREELGSDVGNIEGELFRLDRRTYGILNVGFGVYSEKHESFQLQEGQAYKWFLPEDIVELPLCRLVARNFSHVLHKVAAEIPDVAARVESSLLECYGLRKKNERVYYAPSPPARISMQTILLLKELAAFRGLPVFRVCLHEDDDQQIHEMLMIHTSPSKTGPLRQNKTSLSYHIIEGAIEVLLHNAAGDVAERHQLDSEDDLAVRSIRLDANTFRTVRTVSPQAIFLEVASGPFSDCDTIWLEGRR